MKLLKPIITITLLLLLNCGTVYAYCESGHWLQSKTSDGSVLILEDGSIWKVSSIDTIDSQLWLPIDNIIICEGKLINTDDNTSIEATRIKQ